MAAIMPLHGRFADLWPQFAHQLGLSGRWKAVRNSCAVQSYVTTLNESLVDSLYLALGEFLAARGVERTEQGLERSRARCLLLGQMVLGQFDQGVTVARGRAGGMCWFPRWRGVPKRRLRWVWVCMCQRPHRPRWRRGSSAAERGSPRHTLPAQSSRACATRLTSQSTSESDLTLSQ